MTITVFLADDNLLVREGVRALMELAGDLEVDVAALGGVLDGVVDEVGDDAGESAACDADCTAAACGDGTTNATAIAMNMP